MAPEDDDYAADFITAWNTQEFERAYEEETEQ